MARSNTAKPVKVDKYNKNQNKVHPITWISIAGFFVIILAIFLIFSPTNQEKIYKAYTAMGVTTMPEDHPLYQVTYDGSLFKKGLKDILEKEEVVILYIGYAACPNCQSHVTPISTYFSSTGMNEYTDHVYYLDTTQDVKGFDALAAKYSQIVDSTPQIMVFVDGEIVKLYTPETADTSTPALINRNMRTFYEDSIALINE